MPDVMLDEVVQLGLQERRAPEEIAGAVRRWQSDTVQEGRAIHQSDPEKYWKGTAAVDQDVTAALSGLGAYAQERAAAQFFPDPEQRAQFRSVLESSGNDPERMDAPPEWQEAARKVAEAGDNPAFTPPPAQYGTIGSGPNVIAAYAVRQREDGTGYEAFVQPLGKGKKPVIVPISGDREAFKADAATKAAKADRDYEMYAPSAEGMGFMEVGGGGGLAVGEITDKLSKAQDNARFRLGVANDGPLSQVLHLQLDEALRGDKAFLDQLPQNTIQQFTTRPLAGLARSFAQATAGATGIGKDALTAEGQSAVDVQTPGRLRSRFANNDEATPGDMISQGIESAVTLFGPALATKAVQVAGGLTRAGQAIRAAEALTEATGGAATTASGVASKAGWSGFFSTSYGSNYAGAQQEADALEATDPARAKRIRSLAQWTSLANATIELASERIFPDEARLMRGERLPWSTLALLPLKESAEEFAGTLGQNAVNAASGQSTQSPWQAAQGGFYGSIPILGGGVAARAIPARNAAPAPAVQQPPAFEPTPPEAAPAGPPGPTLVDNAAPPGTGAQAPGNPAVESQAPAGPRGLADVAARAGTVDGGPAADLFPVDDEAATEDSSATGPPEGLTTEPTPQDPFGTVAESPATLQEQFARVAAGVEPAMTIPGATLENLPPEFAPPEGSGLTAMDTPAGVAILPEASVPEFTAAVQAGKLGEALGYGVPDRPANPTGAIVLRNAQGVEVKAAEVDATTRQTVLDTLHDRAQPGDTVAEESLPEVAAKRIGLLEPVLGQEAAPDAEAQFLQQMKERGFLPSMEDIPEDVRRSLEAADATDASPPAPVPPTVPRTRQPRGTRAAAPGQRTRTPRENARRNIAAGWRQIAQDVEPAYGWTDSRNLDEIAQAVSRPDSPVTMQQLGNAVRIVTRSGPLTISPEGNAYSIYSAGMTGSRADGQRSTGSQAYLAAFLWARNNGKRIISHGLTAINRTRRTSNMLSMALRRLAAGDSNFTNHSEPAPEQGLNWQGTPEDKLVDMLLREHDHVAANVPELQDLTYDRRRRTFSFQGNPITSEGIAGFQRNGVGSASIRRAAITRGLLDHPFRPSRSRSGSAVGSGNEGGGRSRSYVGLDRLLYSQPVSPTAAGVAMGGKPLSASVTNPAKVAGEAVTALNNAVPGMVSEQVHFVGTPAGLLASGYAEPGYFSAEEVQQMQGAEGFHDPRTGRTLVFTDQVVRRPGESPRSAVARVILHERVGHDGMNRLLETNPEFAARWDRLAAQIPAGELDAIGRQEGYDHLATDRAQLALEWMARQADRIEGARLAGKIDGWKGLPKQMWEALKAWLAKAYSGFARGPVQAHEVRELVTAARRAALTGTGIPTNSEALQFSLGGSSVFHSDDAPQWQWLRRRLNIQPGQPFRVRNLGMRTFLTGSPLPRAMVNTVEATNSARRAADQAAAQVGRDLQTAVNAVVQRTGMPVATVHQHVNDMMNGVPTASPAVLALDPVLHERTRRARNYLDDLSTAIANTLPVGDLRNTIIGNLGTWMRRSYAAFDPASGWNYDRLNAAAQAGQPVNGVDAARIMRDARAYLRPINQAQYPNATAAEIESAVVADMRDLMDRDKVGNAFAGTSDVRKNVSSLITRQDIPAPLRALMGEETNALHRFTQSSKFQTQFLHRHEGQEALRTIGLANGWFSTTRGDVFTKEIPGATGGTNERWSPLAGLWTTKQLKDALEDTDGGLTSGTDLGGWVTKALVILGHEAKLNRVALNPQSWAPNMLGNVTASINSGDVFYGNVARRVAQAVTLMKAGKARPGDVFNVTAEAVSDAHRAMVARLTSAGVMGNSFSLRDLEATIPRQLLQWMEKETTWKTRAAGAIKGAMVGQSMMRGLGPKYRLAGAVAGGAAGGVAGYARITGWQNKLAGWVMTAPDQLGRLTGFMTNLEAAHASGLTGDDAFHWASERTLNTFPNYDKVPSALRQASIHGIAVGSFVSFQWEVFRNYGWNLRYAAQEIRSQNPALRRRGAARMLGIASVSALAQGGLGGILAAGGAVLSGMGGGGDDKLKWFTRMFRKYFGAEWETNAPLAIMKADKDGVTYMNTSYLLPQATISSLVTAVTEGENPADSASRLVGQFWQMFASGSVNADPLIQAYTNVDGRGNPITNNKGWEGRLERADYAAKVILEPGYARDAEELTYALRGATRNGRSFTVEDKLKGLIGMRNYSRTWPDLVAKAYGRYAAEHRALMAEGNKVLGMNLPGAQVDAVKDTNEGIEQLRQRVVEMEKDMRTMGIPESTIRTARKDSKIGQMKPVTLNPKIKPDKGQRLMVK